LKVSDQGMEWAWVSPSQLASVDASCPGVRHFAFVKGFAPAGPQACDAVASPGDEQGWIRMPSADDANPEGGESAASGDTEQAPPASDSMQQPPQQPPSQAPPPSQAQDQNQ